MQKNKILNVDVSFYRNVTDTEPQPRNLYDLLTSGEYVGNVNKVRSAKPDAVKPLKQSAPCFTPAGLFATGSDASLIRHTGLTCLDFDLKDNTEVENFSDLKTLISAVPFVAYCGLSISGTSYFALIPILRPELHREHFQALARAFRRCGLIVDGSGINLGRKRFLSLDTEPYINPKALTFDRYVKALRPERDSEPHEVSAEDVAELERLAEYSASECIDVTGNYLQWFSIACALANDLGEEGRELFHTFSCASDKYDISETDDKFDNALDAVEVKGKKHPIIATVFHYCREAGLQARADFDQLRSQAID